MFSSRALTSAARIAAPRPQIAARVVASRAYAAAAAPSTGAANKPPVALFGIDGTYASALVRLSRAFWRPIGTPRPLKRTPGAAMAALQLG